MPKRLNALPVTGNDVAQKHARAIPAGTCRKLEGNAVSFTEACPPDQKHQKVANALRRHNVQDGPRTQAVAEFMQRFGALAGSELGLK